MLESCVWMIKVIRMFDDDMRVRFGWVVANCETDCAIARAPRRDALCPRRYATYFSTALVGLGLRRFAADPTVVS